MFTALFVDMDLICELNFQNLSLVMGCFNGPPVGC